MIDTTHTPGPWKKGSTIAGYTAIEAPNKDDPIGWVDFEILDDLHLVMAAPDMLQALLEFISCFPTVPNSIGDEVRQSARKAIAKACGINIKELGPR